MSWDDHYRRQAALDAVLAHARHAPGEPIPFEQVPVARAAFRDAEQVLLALHHRWLRRLTGHVGVADAEATADPALDRVDAVSAAYRRAAQASPVLHHLLVAHESELPAPVREAEQRLLAHASGLAAEDEPADEAARVGAAYLALLRADEPEEQPRQRARRTSPVDLLRRLVASA
ncbi:hypothetical protein [Actinokineospora bangkokensis]|uniref:Uncharacterized protein n=1 Tax=Actinokineospora bangkokensis TaxID=1193682 RepID=A0A1Q9LT83_9PSEU|nr:hypothetical protein [Actinokineospora bangkokensis]OLR95245.1 hypothetical protein BJP25_07085 [Actinokineospora bangkokensis]